ncbi:MAG: DUF1249 domain-containing protein [Gammaproteobacteria bacterium]|nr:DUF1249 domain-containing protein [Gammaproteobacteria bacterium]
MTIATHHKKHFFNQTRLHEANYNLLQQLLGCLDNMAAHYHFDLVGGSTLHIEIKERHRYTTILTLALKLPHLAAFNTDLNIEARLYHDARVVEASHYQGHGRFAVQSHMPNRQGYHLDEKQQANKMLQEALRYSLLILRMQPSTPSE